MTDDSNIVRVPLGELMARQQRVLDAAVKFRTTRAEFLKARTSGVVGRDVAAMRQRKDAAIDELVDAVDALDDVRGIEIGSLPKT